MCGKCCELGIFLLELSAWTPQLEEHLIMKGKKRIADSGIYARYVYYSPCKHFDPTARRCRIQGHKPLICVEYPKDELDLLPGCGYGVRH